MLSLLNRVENGDVIFRHREHATFGKNSDRKMSTSVDEIDAAVQLVVSSHTDIIINRHMSLIGVKKVAGPGNSCCSFNVS